MERKQAAWIYILVRACSVLAFCLMFISPIGLKLWDNQVQFAREAAANHELEMARLTTIEVTLEERRKARDKEVDGIRQRVEADAADVRARLDASNKTINDRLDKHDDTLDAIKRDTTRALTLLESLGGQRHAAGDSEFGTKHFEAAR